MTKILSPEEIVEDMKRNFKVEDIRIERRSVGVKKKERCAIWVKIKREDLHNFVKHIMKYDFPHLAVVSGSDLGKCIQLIYHFTIYYGHRLREILINVITDIPKSDPRIGTVCDLIPGALVTEREKQEMLGIIVEGIPDSRRIFLPDDFPEDVYPWRKDEKGPHKLIKDLYEVEK